MSAGAASIAPFRLREIYKAKNWGGRRLESVAGKTLPPGEPVGESWEVSDVGDDVSVVQGGAWDGRTLRAIAAEETAALYGRGRLAPERFPLLVKFLDAVLPLSIQVHPDDGTALQLGAPSGKTEAWVVLDAEPDAQLYRGLKPEITRDALAALVAEGRVADALHAIPAAPGDAVFVPPGTVHAIGGGIVLYEIQQAADVTYRLDDWGRVGTDGRPRP
ncbi:MAG: type I phosphomannose isomerase catalytic subunit, partial [Planctomycetota bacterium]